MEISNLEVGITSSVVVNDIAEGKWGRKIKNLEDLEKYVGLYRNKSCNFHLAGVIQISSEDYDKLTKDFLVDSNVYVEATNLINKWYAKYRYKTLVAYNLLVSITDGSRQFIISPEGYNSARYVGKIVH